MTMTYRAPKLGLSEEIETNIEDIPLHAYEDDDIDNDIKYNEVTKLIDAMLYLGVDIGSMDAFDMNVRCRNYSIC